jgi:hypothetical protein
MTHLIPFATVIIDAQSALMAGSIIPLVMTRLIRQQPEVEVPRAIGIGALWGLLYAFSVSYMYFNWTDWMLAYLTDSRTFPVKSFYVLFVLACAFCGAAAAAVSAHLVQHYKMGLAALCVVGAILSWLIVLIPSFHGYSHIGTYDEYKAGTALALPGPPDAAFGLNLSGGMTAVFSIVLLVMLIRRSMRA